MISFGGCSLGVLWGSSEGRVEQAVRKSVARRMEVVFRWGSLLIY